jgi:hypothetical protein
MIKTNLFDKNGIEINIGDQYKNINFDQIYNVYFKGGAVCGGVNYERAIPLAWDFSDEGTPICNVDFNWLEIITNLKGEN